MKARTIQGIASTVKDGFTRTPVGKAQSMVLDALEIEASSFGHADALFKAIGITVIPKRVGRRSIPEVSINDDSGGGFNMDGEGEEWGNSNPSLDLSAISQWMVVK